MPKTNETKWIDTSSTKLRNNYNQWWKEHEKKLNETFLRYGIDSLKLKTDQDYVKPLMNLFKRRINKL